MDISTLSLPLRKDRPQGNLFAIRPSITSVNISYETAEAHLNDDNGIEIGEANLVKKTSEPVQNESTATETAPVPVESGKVDLKMHEFPNKPLNVSLTASWVLPHAGHIHTTSSPTSVKSVLTESITPTKDNACTSTRSRRSPSRSSFSLASAECKNFVNFLKEPKFAKPLSVDELAWVFQDFYMKLMEELRGSDSELLSVEEQKARKESAQEVENVLDKAEKVVTGGELNSKLFALGGSHDTHLQPRIDAIREHTELMVAFKQRMDLNGPDDMADDEQTHGESGGSCNSGSSAALKAKLRNPEIVNGININKAIYYLNRLNTENVPKAKLTLLVKAHQSIVTALNDASNGAAADSVLPLFIYSLVKSSATEWWLNFIFIQKFRRASQLVGQSAYCLTNLEAAIHILEQFTLNASDFEFPEGVDPALFAKPITNPRAPRERSGSQSSRGSLSSTGGVTLSSISQRLTDTFSSYTSSLATQRRAHPIIEQRFLNVEADSLTLADVRVLLREYKRLTEFFETRR